jgi:putative sterol carrier protein
VRTGASSDGGMITSTSTGWAGERFSWTGTSSQHAKSTKEKFAVEKKSDKELVVELSLGTPELHVVFEGTCKR